MESKVLISDYCCMSRLNLGWLDNDCTANYNCIVCPLSSIAFQCLGMSKIAKDFHDNMLLNMRYNIKTRFGFSKHTYGSEPGNPVQGQGQGAGNAPSCWGRHQHTNLTCPSASVSLPLHLSIRQSATNPTLPRRGIC